MGYSIHRRRVIATHTDCFSLPYSRRAVVARVVTRRIGERSLALGPQVPFVAIAQALEPREDTHWRDLVSVAVAAPLLCYTQAQPFSVTLPDLLPAYLGPGTGTRFAGRLISTAISVSLIYGLLRF